MKNIKDIYFHIKGTPKQTEASEVTTDNYVRAALVYNKGRGYYWSITRWGKFMLNNVPMESFSFGDRAPSLYECLVPCSRAGKAKEREATELFDSNVFTAVNSRLGYETDDWEVRTS